MRGSRQGYKAEARSRAALDEAGAFRVDLEPRPRHRRAVSTLNLDRPGWGPNVPFDPRRWPFFYGWVIAVVSTLGILASIPGQTMGVSVFTDSLLSATGLSRLTVSNAYLAGTLISGLSLPVAGTLLDRFGARPAGLAACIGLSLVLAYLSQIDRVSAFVVGANRPILTAGLLTFGFFALRFTGQGLLTMTSRTMVGRWFQRRRGMVAGLSGIAIGFAFGATPALFDLWIQAATWRGAWLQMGVVVGIGMGVVVLVFFRDDPEVCGLRMDGAPAVDAVGEGGPAVLHPAAGEPVFTRPQALRTAAFWAVTLCLAAQAMMLTGITFHIIDLAASVSVDRTTAVQLFLPMAIVSVVAAVVGGTLGDRLPVRVLLVTMMLGLGLGVFGAADLADRWWFAVVGLGISGGLFSPTSTIAYPRFFGRKHLGAILGVEMMSLVIASAIGPSLLASSQAAFGDYGPALYASLSLPLIGVVLSLTFRAPRGRDLDPASSDDDPHKTADNG